MQYRVLGTTDVQVHAVVIHPVFLSRAIDEPFFIPGIKITQVIPATTRPLRHGVGLTRGSIRQIHPVRRARQGRITVGGGLIVIQLWRQQRQVALLQRLMMPFAPHNRKGFTPVSLPAKEPVSQLEIDRSPPAFLFLEPINYLRLRLRR